MISGRSWLLARLTWVVVAVVFVTMLGGFHPADRTRDVVVGVAAVMAVGLNVPVTIEGVRGRVWGVLLGVAARLIAVGWVLLVVRGVSHEPPDWDAKDAWRRCQVDARWPEESGARCRALHMCVNEAAIDKQAVAGLIAATPNCPAP